MDINYKTSDFNTAVILHAHGCKMTGKESHNKRVRFHFQNDDLLISLIEARMTGILTINPEKIFSSERFLRSIIKEEIIKY